MDQFTPEPSPTHRIFVIGASAGGVEAFTQLIPLLPADFPAPVFLVMHVMAHSPSYLPPLLSARSALKVTPAVDGEPLEPGTVYIAPPNHHLLIEPGHMHLSTGPKENRHRPAVNSLFRSAALAYGPQVVGIVLTGNLDDGTIGLWEIKRRGGITVVQDPGEATYPGMPQSALDNVDIDYVIKLDDLPPLMVNLANHVEKGGVEVGADSPGKLTSLTCPECRGPIHEHQTGRSREFRCRVGHAYAPHTMLDAHGETIERALWAGVVALEEGADLAQIAQDLLPIDTPRFKKETKLKRGLARKLRGMIDQLANQGNSDHSDQ
jgi:two-component system chemotaxis response regulator CheB